MKVIAFNGSGRKDGNTAVLLNKVLDELSKEGIETELIQLAGKAPQGCMDCRRCFENKDRKCAVTTDNLNEYLARMIKAEGILPGSPVYFTDVTAGIKELFHADPWKKHGLASEKDSCLEWNLLTPHLFGWDDGYISGHDRDFKGG